MTACQIVVCIILLNTFYLDFATESRLVSPFFPRPNFSFYLPYVAPWKVSVMHNTKPYTRYVQDMYVQDMITLRLDVPYRHYHRKRQEILHTGYWTKSRIVGGDSNLVALLAICLSVCNCSRRYGILLLHVDGPPSLPWVRRVRTIIGFDAINTIDCFKWISFVGIIFALEGWVVQQNISWIEE